MKTKTNVLRGASAAFLAQTNKFMPQIMFAPEGEGGSGSGEDIGDKDKAAEEAAAAAAAAAAEEAAKGKKPETDPEKAELLREVMDKKGKLKTAEEKAAAAAAALAAYDGVDPQKVKDLLKKEREAETAAAEAKGDFDRVKAMMVEEHNKEKKTLSDQLAELNAQLAAKDSIIDGLTVGNDFSSSVYIKDSLTLSPVKARKLYGSHFEVKDGRTVAFDKPAGAKDRTELTGADGKPLTFDAAFKRIIDADPDKDSLLKATIQPGSGSRSVQEKAQEQSNKSKVKGIDRLRGGSLDDLIG